MNSIVNLARELIAIDTAQKNESQVADIVESFLGLLGFESHRIAISRRMLEKHPAYTCGDYSYDGRDNGVFILKGKNPGRSLLFNAHSDVVPAGDEGAWTSPPFQTSQSDGKLFGRGAADTKGGLAALLIAVKELRESGWAPDYDLIIEVVADEEGGGNGTLACMADGVRADAAIFIEPMGANNLVIGHRGGMKFTLTVSAAGAQLEARGKDGAIEAMAAAVKVIREFAAEYATKPAPADYAGLANSRPVYLGKITGGSWFSSLAMNCSLEGVIGWLPDDTQEKVQQQFREYVCSEFASRRLPAPLITFPQHHINPCKTDINEKIVQVANRAIKVAMPEKSATIACANCGTDMWIRRIFGKTPCIVLGPGGGNCHMPDEFVLLEELEKSKSIFKNILLSW